MAILSWGKEKKAADGTQSKSEADELIEKLGPAIGAAIEEKFKPLNDQFSALKNDWDSLKAEATRETQPDPNRNSDGTELTAEQRQAAENKKILLVSILTNARLTEQQCIDDVKAAWPNLVPEIRRVLATIPVDDKAKADYPQRCQNAVDLIIGREAKKNGLRQDRNTGKFMIEDSAARTGGEDSPLLDPDMDWVDERSGRRLTAGQQLEKLHIDPKQFAEFMKKQAV